MANDKAYHKRYREQHQEQILAYQIVYRQVHRERILARARAYQRAHREERLVYSAAYNLANRDRLRAYFRKYDEQHRDERRAKDRAYRQSHKDACYAKAARHLARKKNSPINDFTLAQWVAVKVHYGFKCVYCGKKQQRLSMDHITPLSKGGSHTISNIVPACRSCNSKKHTGSPLRPVQPLLLAQEAK